ncbi:MAG: hypothetical protein ACI37O_06255 [Candidatus Avelusimicrobium sp.]|uniref:hypothetical protein n=1 Tax=Candidatus Avelusimicrobium sp. TaxID=3048833 RepID=UPI003F0C8A7D
MLSKVDTSRRVEIVRLDNAETTDIKNLLGYIKSLNGTKVSADDGKAILEFAKHSERLNKKRKLI